MKTSDRLTFFRSMTFGCWQLVFGGIGPVGGSQVVANLLRREHFISGIPSLPLHELMLQVPARRHWEWLPTMITATLMWAIPSRLLVLLLPLLLLRRGMQQHLLQRRAHQVADLSPQMQVLMRNHPRQPGCNR
jgi:hypothetical protein